MKSGTQLGHYTISSLIGKGGMGEGHIAVLLIAGIWRRKSTHEASGVDHESNTTLIEDARFSNELT